MGRPNIILLTFDALRYDFLGHAGGPAETPHLDRLAEETVSFTEAYSTASWTAPSFKSMFTGYYPLEKDGRVSLKEDDDHSFVEELQDAGYQTLGFPHHPYLCRFYGFERGFDVFRDGIDFGNASWTEQLKRRVLDSHIGNYVRLANSIYGRHSCKKLGDIIDELVDEDLDDPPFFAWMHSLDTHTPFTPPADFERVSRRRSFQVHKARYDYRNGKIDAEEFRPYLDDLKALYISEIEYLDAQVGRLLEELEERGLREETAIIITADHGEELLEHGHLHHQRYIYEELTHVPLYIDLPEDRTELREDIVSLIDIGPTVLNLAHRDADGRLDPADSLLKGEKGVAFMHAAEGDILAGTDPSPYLSGEQKLGVRKGNWHYIRNTEGDDELFRVTEDRGEQHDLIGEQDVPDDVAAALDDHESQMSTNELIEDLDV